MKTNTLLTNSLLLSAYFCSQSITKEIHILNEVTTQRETQMASHLKDVYVIPQNNLQFNSAPSPQNVILQKIVGKAQAVAVCT